MFIIENGYEIRKKYCPSQRKNVMVKVYYGPSAREECTEQSTCEATGGCSNHYLHSANRISNSL